MFGGPIRFGPLLEANVRGPSSAAYVRVPSSAVLPQALAVDLWTSGVLPGFSPFFGLGPPSFGPLPSWASIHEALPYGRPS